MPACALTTCDYHWDVSLLDGADPTEVRDPTGQDAVAEPDVPVQGPQQRQPDDSGGGAGQMKSGVREKF